MRNIELTSCNCW